MPAHQKSRNFDSNPHKWSARRRRAAGRSSQLQSELNIPSAGIEDDDVDAEAVAVEPSALHPPPAAEPAPPAQPAPAPAPAEPESAEAAPLPPPAEEAAAVTPTVPEPATDAVQAPAPVEQPVPEPAPEDQPQPEAENQELPSAAAELEPARVAHGAPAEAPKHAELDQPEHHEPEAAQHTEPEQAEAEPASATATASHDSEAAPAPFPTELAAAEAPAPAAATPIIPTLPEGSRSQLQHVLTPEVFGKLAHVRTRHGVTLEQCMQSALANPDADIGLYAGDAESYTAFADVFQPLIQRTHGFAADGVHPAPAEQAVPAVTDAARVKSIRVSVSRNVDGFAFSSCISGEDRSAVEALLVSALAMLDGDTKGEYAPLATMPETLSTELLEEGVLFQRGDRFREAAGMNRDWPSGRGVFANRDHSIVAWINGEDHLLLTCLQDGADFAQAHARITAVCGTAVKVLAHRPGRSCSTLRNTSSLPPPSSLDMFRAASPISALVLPWSPS